MLRLLLLALLQGNLGDAFVGAQGATDAEVAPMVVVISAAPVLDNFRVAQNFAAGRDLVANPQQHPSLQAQFPARDVAQAAFGVQVPVGGMPADARAQGHAVHVQGGPLSVAQDSPGREMMVDQQHHGQEYQPQHQAGQAVRAKRMLGERRPHLFDYSTRCPKVYEPASTRKTPEDKVTAMIIQPSGPLLLPAPKPPLLLPAPPALPGDTFTPGNDEVVITAPPPQLSHPADKFFSEQPLGALYAPDSTTFRVFAPTASKLQLNVYNTPQGGEARKVELKRNGDGTWEANVAGNLQGSYYTYQAAGDDPGFHFEREIPDPYSQCVTACDGRSMILNDQTPVADRPNFPQQDAILYEMHLRDFTIDPDSGVQRRGKYLGLTEGGTTLTGHPDVKTGLDHISELGVNAVQIMPFSEFASDEKNDNYGWGYDPALYQTPDGWYTSERLDGSRVREAKQMVDALHKRGIRVVMDMVLNHTDEGLRQRGNAFEGLVPGYYYRRRKDGSNFDGAACGNEIRSEAPMVRRFIKDTLKHWVKDYKVDGFRFDLMGLMDKQTAKELTQELRQLDPNLLIYGEPWAAGETPIEVLGKGSQKGLGFGVFNDNFRDSLKGSVFQPREQGFIQSGARTDAIRKGIAGSIDDFTAGPNETINYAECHDNHTLWDRLQLSTENDPKISDADRKAMDRLAAAVLFTSQGIPFIQSGQEMLRTKHGDDNSYNKPDSVNMIRWDQKLENRDTVGYYQGLIGLRKNHPMFHLATAEEIRKGLKFQDSPSKTISYTLTDPTGRDSWKRAQVVFNPSATALDLPVPAGNWRIYVDGQNAGNQPVANSAVKLENGRLKVPPRTAVVLGEARATSAVAP